MSQTEKQKVGKRGEDIACMFLMKHGYTVVERNYWKKFGEIDIVARKGGILHFIEVKSVSRDLGEEKREGTPTSMAGRHETSRRKSKDEYRPEDNLHPWKLKRLSRAIEIYIFERKVPHETDWQLDAITVLIDEKKRVGRVKLLENIVI